MRPPIPAVLLALALVGCGGGTDSSDEPKPPESSSTVDLKAASEACKGEVEDELAKTGDPSDPLPADVVMRLGGDGSLDVSPLQVQPFLVEPSVTAAVCVLRETGAPDSVVSTVSQARGVDGRQEASWDGVDLSYTYDGNSGFAGVFTAN